MRRLVNLHQSPDVLPGDVVFGRKLFDETSEEDQFVRELCCVRRRLLNHGTGR